jgi:nicotinamidase-related amidase
MGDLLTLNLRSQVLATDEGGHRVWRRLEQKHQWPAAETALLLCDIWDNHWSRGAVERLEAMLPSMEQVVQVARDRGVQIIHAPSDTMEFYGESAARARALQVPALEPPCDIEREDPPLPVDAADHGSDTEGDEPHEAWHRQHAGITIDEESDIISDQGTEIYSILKHEGIEHLLIMGVHTNMCVLHRTFAIKQMVRWGVDIALVRDLTDTMYNPAMSPYVEHDEGTRLVVEFIEKFWCPSVESADVTLG